MLTAQIGHDGRVELIIGANEGLAGVPGRGKCTLITNRKKIAAGGSGDKW